MTPIRRKALQQQADRDSTLCTSYIALYTTRINSITLKTHLETGACEAVLGFELLHVLKAVVDEAEPSALAPAVVGSEAEERYRRRVGHAELLLGRHAEGRRKQ